MIRLKNIFVGVIRVFITILIGMHLVNRISRKVIQKENHPNWYQFTMNPILFIKDKLK